DVSSCTGRCGEGFSREHDCHCDFNCHHYMECCPDFNKVCTVAVSCKGRCFELFERGRECDCDADCERYGKCCPDYAAHCKEEVENTYSVHWDSTTWASRPPALGYCNHWQHTERYPSSPHLESKPEEQPSTETSVQDEKDLCSGKPADGMVALPNGTLAVFRGEQAQPVPPAPPSPTNPRLIRDGWGIPSPIDAVFSRCNCDGKTFFIKGPLYWRFTNGVMDKGYPKPLANGFAGLSGKIVATLPVARYNSRPESVYFLKKDGNMQQYVYRQEPAKKCQRRRTQVTIRYPAFVPRLVIRRRVQRALRTPTIIQSVRINPHPSGNFPLFRVLRKEVKTATYWRGLPKVIHSTISLPNHNKPDGYDYYAFSYNRYYSLDVGKRIARPVTALTGKTVSKDWYNCP
ncbi:Proteoglycan 4, partial [Chaetura pelagica]